jgi:hypothetical protein
MAGVAESYAAAAESLASAGAIDVTARTVSKLATQIGEQLRVERDRRAAEYEQQPLPRVATKVEPLPELAAVFGDGGRIGTRRAGGGRREAGTAFTIRIGKKRRMRPSIG